MKDTTLETYDRFPGTTGVHLQGNANLCKSANHNRCIKARSSDLGSSPRGHRAHPPFTRPSLFFHSVIGLPTSQIR